MNYFAHGRTFVEQPYFLAGTAVPDWLNVVNRRVKARSKAARLWIDDADERVAFVARGIMQHHADDDWFHQSRAFLETQWRFTLQLRERLPADDRLRPSFLGHILVELLLDSTLIREAPERLDAYYAAVERLDPTVVQKAVECVSGKELPTLASWIPRFCQERFLYDYQEDGKLLARLNMVMRRVGLSPLPASLVEWLPEARSEVDRQRSALLASGPETGNRPNSNSSATGEGQDP
ncbi:MAG: hypothetical protein U0939_06195 [Pirellulales bacterium]